MHFTSTIHLYVVFAASACKIKNQKLNVSLNLQTIVNNHMSQIKKVQMHKIV